MPFRQNTLLSIDGKVIGIEHVRELAEMLIEEYDKLHSLGAQGIEFSVKCFDNTSFSSNDLTLFGAKSPVLKKRVRSIEMAMHPAEGTFVKIGLFHGSEYDTVEKEHSNASFMELGSDDSMWVNGFAARLQEWLGGVTDQNDLINTYRFWIYLAAIISGTISLGFLIDLSNGDKVDYVSFWNRVLAGSDWLALTLGALFVGGGMAWIVVGSFMTKSPDIWPIVELQIGPDHLLLEKKRRNYLYQILALIILPILTSIVTSAIS